MKLLQVRKGQFVYYNNELHKVYSVKPMFRKSVHLYRLKDMRQILTSAGEIQLCKPKHMDSFIFYGHRYTIDKDKTPEKGDYILIIKPAPDFLDRYSLNEVEKVDKVEDGNIVTTRDNGVKHHEYVTMVPGKLEGSIDIAYFDRNMVSEEQLQVDESPSLLIESDSHIKPSVGDIYLDYETGTRFMIVALTEKEIICGHGPRLSFSELINEERYTPIYREEEDF
ncbi:hypothetical protein F9U64_19185 [Gracilibacillus oryzae]|uniref:Uncharacterized protein n=1 Tax=Gracilibacillus oryzae TaxID=1672701 RepID=A0A7C8KQ71_9BACI|nr:hypothetical protein [Gracilibacillus oryzae]KAB8126804.1 hypothetical protein F9U64_19185 [Gracilibacillus oryzae]